MTENVHALRVLFDSGHELLSSYWGYLSHGGLVLANDDTLEVGKRVELQVSIRSAEAGHRLVGKVVRRNDDNSKMVVAFEPDQPHDMLLTDALAETENVPARQYRRYNIDVAATIGDGAGQARVVNVSEGGVCLTFSTIPTFKVGTHITIHAGDLSLTGTVMWVNNRHLGVAFGAANDGGPDALQLIQSYLATLQIEAIRAK